MLKAKTTSDKGDTLLGKSLVPIIDLAHCGTEECPVKSVVNRVGQQLAKALSEKGMALLVNHGISDEKLKTAWDHLDDFCELSTEVKEHYIRSGETKHGYVQPLRRKSTENGNMPELRHAFNICTLNSKNLPEEPLPGFADHISTLATEFKALAKFVLQSLAVSLEIPQTFFLEKHSHMFSGENDNETTLRLLYYPPIIEEDDKDEHIKGRCKYTYQKCLTEMPDFKPEEDPREQRKQSLEKEQEEKERESAEAELNKDDTDKASSSKEFLNGHITRSNAHTDYGTFTLLVQDSEGGLEVQLPGSEKWQRVGHLPGAILIFCGEILSIWTQEKYSALQHRVVVPEQEHLRIRGRHSIAFFCHPDNLTMISPNDLPQSAVAENTTTKKTRKKSFKAAKERVFNAYQMIQKRIKDSYSS